MFLLDANALIALADGDHVHHERVRSWFRRSSARGWATCPLTENAFVRILSSPGYANSPGSPAVVREVLGKLCLFAGHQFWEDAVSLRDVRRFPSLSGVSSGELTDLYLIALAMHRKGSLATLDRRIDAGGVPGGAKACLLIP